jgi:hypothetical protein
LASWELVLPSRLRNAQRVAIHHLPTPGTGPSVDPTALTLIAAAVRSRMRIAQRDAFNDLRMANAPDTIHWGTATHLLLVSNAGQRSDLFMATFPCRCYLRPGPCLAGRRLSAAGWRPGRSLLGSSGTDVG